MSDDNPSIAVAVEEEFVRDAFARHGLRDCLRLLERRRRRPAGAAGLHGRGKNAAAGDSSGFAGA